MPLLNFRISDELNERILERIGQLEISKSEWCRQIVCEALDAAGGGGADSPDPDPCNAPAESADAHPSWATPPDEPGFPAEVEAIRDPVERLGAKVDVITGADGAGDGEPAGAVSAPLTLDELAKRIYYAEGVTMPVARRMARERMAQ